MSENEKKQVDGLQEENEFKDQKIKLQKIFLPEFWKFTIKVVL